MKSRYCLSIRVFFVLLTIHYSLLTYSQYNPDKVNPKAREVYDKAMLQLADGLVRDAVPLLGKAMEYDPGYVDAYLSLAGVQGELKHYDESVRLYEKARALDPTYFKPYLLPYSINLAGQGRFDDALKATQEFLSLPSLNDRSRRSGEFRRKSFQFAVDYSAAHHDDHYVFSPVNLGAGVNSAASEYYPSFTGNDSLLVFTRKEGNGKATREDFYQSQRDPRDGARWLPATRVRGDINLEPYKGAVSVSQDGDWLIFTADLGPKGLGNFDIYISYNTGTGWSEPVNLGPNINTDSWESAPSLSPDKSTLYFASNRPGGYGGSDIYYCRRVNGKWLPAVNMGPSVNTSGDEQAPFIHADNQTLYFTSNGWPGYGGSDLFLIRREGGDSWSKPENLGYPVNTIEDEGTLSVASDGVTAYYASDRADSRGGLDLYSFTLRPDIRPSRTFFLSGHVKDAETGKPLPSTVNLTDNSSGKTVFTIQTDESGSYLITLPVGHDYTFTVARKGYLFYSEAYRLAGPVPDSVYRKEIALQPLKAKTSFVLRNILFATGSSELDPVSHIELDRLVQLMKENSSVKIAIGGHTDNIGREADNVTLSANRARSVAAYLQSQGIDASRISTAGYGAAKPVAPNDTEAGRALNRRTEFTIAEL